MDFSTLVDCVRRFHTSFRVPVLASPTPDIGENRFLLRHRLMEEENNEYLQACKTGDLVEIADALGDQLYILLGTLLEHGLQDKIEEAFVEIHFSNMSKLDEKGNPLYRADGKVAKSPQYFPPNIKRVLTR